MMKEPKVAFITLTNNGYVYYTLNCLESLKKIGFKKDLITYAIGQKAYKTLLKRGFKAKQIGDEESTGFQRYRTGNWANVVSYKFEIIHQNLQNHDFVCFTDGDVVFENTAFYQYCLDNIGSHDILFQNDLMDDNDDGELCSGFMFIRSNEKTLALINPDKVKLKSKEGWGDQIYFNEIKGKLDYKKLPLTLFPNGKYYRENYNTFTPFMIHFNFLIGHNKAYMILKYKKTKSLFLFFKFSLMSKTKIIRKMLRRPMILLKKRLG